MLIVRPSVFVGKSPVDILRQEQERVRLVAAAFINTVGKRNPGVV